VLVRSNIATRTVALTSFENLRGENNAQTYASAFRFMASADQSRSPDRQGQYGFGARSCLFARDAGLEMRLVRLSPEMGTSSVTRIPGDSVEIAVWTLFGGGLLK
jgi:hypothetical protein